MSGKFLEERLPVTVRLGASYGDDYAVDITTTAGGEEFRRLIHPFPVRSFRVKYTEMNDAIWSKVLALYHRAYGRYAGFRVRCWDDFSTHTHTGVPTFSDVALVQLTTTTWQLVKYYGSGSTALDIGLPARVIYKPVAGTVLISKRSGSTYTQISSFTVNTTTGVVTLPAPLAAGETLYGGCEFDIPARFDSNIQIDSLSKTARSTDELEIVELLTP